jgi:hypothetical protein
MTLLLMLLNAAACFAIFWSTGTFLLARDRATCVRHLMTQVGLLFAMVGAFATGLAPFVDTAVPEWWVVVLLIGVGTVALTQYDKVFGIAAQFRNVVNRVHMLPAVLQAWWAERMAIAHKHAKGKR